MAAPDALPTIPVVVRWAGTDYPIEVPPDANIEYLKRKFADIGVLPCKRLKFKQETLDCNDFNEDLLLSTLPTNRINLIGLNQRNDIRYKQIFRAHDTNYQCHVTDQREPLIDFDGNKMGMSRGIYEVITVKVDCLLKMQDEKSPIDQGSFELVKHFRHPNSVVIENIYKSGGSLRLILSASLDGSLDGYIHKWGLDKVYDSTTKASTDFFTKIITDLCGVLDKLIAKGVCPKGLSSQNLYLKMINGYPQLRVLFNSVEPVAKLESDKARQLKTLCADIKSIISSYITNEVALSDETRWFFEFLGKEAANFFGFNLKFVAQSYPRNWTDERKCSYLIDVTSSTVDLRPAINRCGIKWPKNELIEIKEMVEEDNKRIQQWKNILQSQNRTEEADRLRFRKWNYDTKFPYDLVRMVRNFWKHFSTLPWELQEYLGDRAGALRALERWCPGVWCLIYNAVGIV